MQAQAFNPGNALLTITTPLTVELDAQFDNLGASGDGGVLDAGRMRSNPEQFADDLRERPGRLLASADARVPEQRRDAAAESARPRRALDSRLCPRNVVPNLVHEPRREITYYARCGDLGGS